MSTVMPISLPGRVFDDYLDPIATSNMEAELGLPVPELIRRGKGFSAMYPPVTLEVAEKTARYLADRADRLLAGDIDDDERHVHYAARRSAHRIHAQIRRNR